VPAPGPGAERRLDVHQVRAGGGDTLRQTLHELHVGGGHKLKVRHGVKLCQHSDRPSNGFLAADQGFASSSAMSSGVTCTRLAPMISSNRKARVGGVPRGQH
jgi:hypothetical protein